MSVSFSRSCKTAGKLFWSFSYDCTREIIAVKMVQSALKSMHEKSQNQTVKSPHWLLSSAAARSYPVPRTGDTEDTDIRYRIRIRIRPGKTLKLHLPEGYGMSATSTTKLEPLSDHGTAARVRHSRAHLPLDPLSSRRSLSRSFTSS